MIITRTYVCGVCLLPWGRAEYDTEPNTARKCPRCGATDDQEIVGSVHTDDPQVLAVWDEVNSAVSEAAIGQVMPLAQVRSLVQREYQVALEAGRFPPWFRIRILHETGWVSGRGRVTAAAIRAVQVWLGEPGVCFYEAPVEILNHEGMTEQDRCDAGIRRLTEDLAERAELHYLRWLHKHGVGASYTEETGKPVPTVQDPSYVRERW